MNAQELFDICQELAVLNEPTPHSYRRMHEVLTLACGEGTRHHGGNFGNLFAQVDYLCKQCGVSSADRVEIQTMRRHAGMNAPTTIEASEWTYDLRALTLFVAAVTGESVPGSLRQLIPAQGRPSQSSVAKKCKYLRCIVRSWNGQYIEADTSNGNITVDYGTTENGRDFAYLNKLLREGMQLNLLENDYDEGIYRPRVIVVEPDFLIDISSLAACFTNYGHHPLLYTIGRLKARPNTQAILLGNFAGVALDYLIAHPTESSVLTPTLQRSMRQQALRFCSCADFNGPRFKADAENQLRNIAQAIGLLRQEEKPREGLQERQGAMVLEPSFVCEQLGLQGRVDLMSADMQLLVEQKAGKNMKIEHESHDPHGQQQESHYVQLLLYYGILRYNFGRSDQQVDTRLLYSRYPAQQGLLSVNYYRTLLRQAIMLRNQIVATELLIAREGFGRILPLLTPDIIYKDVKPDGYFAQYVVPQLLQLTAPLSQLSELERTYYERMMTFVYREQAAHKLGNAESRLYHSGGAASDLWLMPLAEKLDTGNLIMNLRLNKLDCSQPQSGYDVITLQTDATEHAATPAPINFRLGDMVYLYAYEGEPDVRKSMLYKGNIIELNNDSVVVQLNNGQQDARLFDHPTWAIEHGGSDQGTTSDIRALQQFIEAPAHRRALLLGQRSPRADEQLQLSRSYSHTYDPLLLRAKQARDYFLLVGPPGTGKTSQALRFLVKEELSDSATQPATVLLTAYTNRAVDEICGMLSDEGIPFLRLGNAASCDPQFHPYLIDTLVERMGTLDALKHYIQSIAVVVGTTSTLSAHQDIFSLKQFSLAIVDEASQILEPNIIGLLSSEQIERFILVGDYKQLPAVVQQTEQQARVDEPLLRTIGLEDCRQSLFERLIRWERRCQREQFIGILNHQGRMHPEVACFAQSHFYASEQLQPVPLEHQRAQTLGYTVAALDALDQLLQQQRMLFLPAERSNEGDKASAAEARIVALVAQRIYRFYGSAFDARTTIGIIVPYRNQIALVRQELAQTGIEALNHLTIDTVERYQGSQRDVIIYSFTISRPYQLDFLTAQTFTENGYTIDRKLNVAMTRARKQLIMTGYPDVLQRNPLFKELIQTYSIPSSSCLHLSNSTI